MNPIADDLFTEFGYLQGDRGTWNSHWQEIAQRILPSYSNLFHDAQGEQTRGDKRNTYMFDSTASVALGRFGAILDSLLTPRSSTWHRLVASDSDLNENREVKLWFETVNRILFKYRYAPKANFASQNQQNFISLGAFGTGCMFIDQLKGEPGLRYKNNHLGEVYFCENHQGIIDIVYRKFPLRPRQAIQQFGDKTPKKIIEAYDKNRTDLFYFLHCVKPREDYDPKRIDYKGMKYASYYLSFDDQSLLTEEGYSTFPYTPSRYSQIPGEVYGRSPAMDVLPAIKTLNEEKKTILKQGHRVVDPVLLAHDDGVLDTFSLKPGSIVAGGVSAEGRQLIHALPVGNLSIGKDLMDDERAIINDAFLVTLFQILVETPQMTATEVIERTREKGILLAPTVGRQQSEYLGPLIEREIDVLSRQGLLPPMPEILKEREDQYRIEYDSPLSRAQRAEEVAGLLRTVETTLNIVNVTQNPEPLDHFNWDKIIPEVAEIQAVPIRWLKSKDEVQTDRDKRSQQQQQQQAVNSLPGVAAMTKAAAVAGKSNE